MQAGVGGRRPARHRIKGFTLIELAIVGSVLTIAAVLAAGRLMQEINDAAAVATGSYLLTIKTAMDGYLVKNYDRLAAPAGAIAVPSVASPLAPTLIELRNLGMLQNGFPDRTPFNQAVAVRIVRSGDCPGESCRLDALVHATSPLTLPGSSEPAMDLVGQVLLSSAGHGGASHWATPGVIRGSAFSTSNPLGAVPGVVGVLASLDTTLFNQFVRMRDQRDPDLQGNLTVAGGVAVRDRLVVGGDSQNPCVVAERTGVVRVGCAGQLQAATGSFVTGGGNAVHIDPSTGVQASGRVRADAGLATARGTLFDATDADPTLRVASRRLVMATDEGTALVVNGRDVRGAGGMSATRLDLREVAAVNQSCSPAFNENGQSSAEIARTAGGGLLACVAGTWRALAELARSGDACTTSGALATDSMLGTGLVCRLGVWASMDDLLSSYVLVATQLVRHGEMVVKPECGPLGTGRGQPLIYLLAQIESSKGAAFTRRAEDLGSVWRVLLLDYDSTPLAGPATAIAQIYCRY